jgi:hypothetical protein
MQPFREYSLYGGRNRLQIAIEFSLDLVRTLLLASILAAVSVVAAQRPQSKPLTEKELRDFLGPVSPEAFRWSKYTMIDFELYNGEAKSPFSGQVAFYLGGHPHFKPAANSSLVKGRLGRYQVDWYRSLAQKGAIQQQALIRLDDYWQVDLTVTAKRQENVDQIIATIAKLPLFSQPPKPAFGSHPSDHPW